MHDASGIERRLVLVRHGESTWNALGLVQGQADAPGLTDRGRRQAVTLADQLQRRPVVALVSSDLTRAQETADIIARRVGSAVVLDERVRERDFGVFEGGPSGALGCDVTGVSGEWVIDADLRPAGGESVRDLYDRVAWFVDSVRDGPDGDVVVVCHGGAIRVASAYLEGIAVDAMPWAVVDNTQVATFEMTKSGRTHERAERGLVAQAKGSQR
jgi:broad specificity phosphatase PhoE